jgi:hypothetical protein
MENHAIRVVRFDYFLPWNASQRIDVGIQPGQGDRVAAGWQVHQLLL